MNDDNITIPLQFHLIHSIPIARTGTAAYPAEKDRVWKNPYIIYAGNAKPLGKIIRKKLKKVLTLNRAMLYNTDVSRERGTNPEPGARNIETMGGINYDDYHWKGEKHGTLQNT